MLEPQAELKHGRIAMLAWLGMVAPDFIRLPGAKFSFEAFSCWVAGQGGVELQPGTPGGVEVLRQSMQAIPVSIDAHDAFRGATGVNAQVLFPGGSWPYRLPSVGRVSVCLSGVSAVCQRRISGVSAVCQ